MMRPILVLVAAALLCASLPSLDAHAQPLVLVRQKAQTTAFEPATEAAAPDAVSSKGAIAAPAPALKADASDPAPDPTEDLGGFLEAARGAFASGKLLFVVLLLWGFARVAYKLRDSVGFLSSWKARAALVGGTGVLAAAAISLGAGGPFDWATLVGAISAAIALYMRPEPAPATI